MAQEIERKFLVKSDAYKLTSHNKTHIKQGFLSSVPERTVRIRVKGEQGFITVKGISNASGVSRYEWEKEISVKDADELLSICESGIIEKIRFDIVHGEHTFEVDEFYGENEDLVIAEVELSSEDEIYKKPDWLGEEVTGELKYYNSMLAKCPFKKWK